MEWVRDGLPLAPHWFHPEGWNGGLIPPEPKISQNEIKQQENCFALQGKDPTPAIRAVGQYLKFDWQIARAVYRVYAQLPPERLREFHRQGQLRLKLSDLPLAQQDSLAEAVDTGRLSGNIGFGYPLEENRPPEAAAPTFWNHRGSL